MKQYWDIKSLHGDKILFFRMGDFYELFFDDAIKAAPLLGIALTSRNKKAQDETPMCGLPHHAVAGPINRLLGLGLKVALCDQIEDPKLAKGIVKRAVTRILTPGMVFDSTTLDPQLPNYMATWEQGVLACLDTSTGEAIFWSNLSPEAGLQMLKSLPVVEIVCDEGSEKSENSLAKDALEIVRSTCSNLVASEYPIALRRLCAYAQSLGCSFAPEDFVQKSLAGKMELSHATLKHLEIFVSGRGGKEGSLLRAVDRTKTSPGARLLRSRLAFPEVALDVLERRWDAVEMWSRSAKLLPIRQKLAEVGDLERQLSRVSLTTGHGRDLRSLQSSMQAALESMDLASQVTEGADRLQNLARRIDSTLVLEPPLSVRQGYLIQTGVSPELDEAIHYSTQAQTILQELEARERASTGISSLKIRYNQVFGYYIEITNTHRAKAPEHYQRKQTLANAERYTTDELVEIERKVLAAQSRRNDLEFAIFEELRLLVGAERQAILALAHLIAELDVESSFAVLSIERAFVRPQIVEDRINLRGSRHPVVEQIANSPFIANDIVIEKGECLLLTGPNMAGKSTLMRQVALTALLAQAGSFVPATSAELPIFHRILTRIGAQDSLSEGLSTFMVEMKETAAIVAQADHRSLVVLDEIGRGTSTFDGLSLAQSILEHLLNYGRPYLLFATHYHELTPLATMFPQIKNTHMAIAEKGGEIRFLFSLRTGPAEKSYGIHVAELAGLPKGLIRRARAILHELEGRGDVKEKQLSFQTQNLSMIEETVGEDNTLIKSEGSNQLHFVLKDLADFPVNSTTPLEALKKITEWQNSIQSEGLHN